MATAVVFAYHDVGVRCLRVLLDAGVEVALVVTHRDDPGETIWFSSVFDFSTEKNLKVQRDPVSLDIPQADFVFSFYYRRMLPPEVLKKGRKGAFNMHGSLLPKYRGRAPVNWAVIRGERETGATLHQMTEKPDAGGIIGQERVPIGPDDTAVEVFRRVTDAAELVLKRNIGRMIAGTARPVPQDLSKGSYFGGRKPADGRIDWSKSAEEIHNLVRGVAPPYPGAFSGELQIHRTQIEEEKKSTTLGPYRKGKAWFAGCGDGRVLRLLEVVEKK